MAAHQLDLLSYRQPEPNKRAYPHRDITRNYHGGNPNSVAAEQTTPRETRAKQRERVVAFIEAAGLHGSTCDEFEEATGIRHQTASARFTELKADGVIVEIGRRNTRSGKKAGVYVMASLAAEKIAATAIAAI